MNRPLQPIEMTSVRCIALFDGIIKAHRCLIKDGNIVLVWSDSINNFSANHRMPPSIQRTMILNAARR